MLIIEMKKNVHIQYNNVTCDCARHTQLRCIFFFSLFLTWKKEEEKAYLLVHVKLCQKKIISYTYSNIE
jgi:hypothetical protein